MPINCRIPEMFFANAVVTDIIEARTDAAALGEPSKKPLVTRTPCVKHRIFFPDENRGKNGG